MGVTARETLRHSVRRATDRKHPGRGGTGRRGRGGGRGARVHAFVGLRVHRRLPVQRATAERRTVAEHAGESALATSATRCPDGRDVRLTVFAFTPGNSSAAALIQGRGGRLPEHLDRPAARHLAIPDLLPALRLLSLQPVQRRGRRLRHDPPHRPSERPSTPTPTPTPTPWAGRRRPPTRTATAYRLRPTARTRT